MSFNMVYSRLSVCVISLCLYLRLCSSVSLLLLTRRQEFRVMPSSGNQLLGAFTVYQCHGAMLAAQSSTEGSKSRNVTGQLGLDWEQDKPCPSCLQTFSTGGERQQLCCNMWGQHKSQHCHWAVTLSAALLLNTPSSCFWLGDVPPRCPTCCILHYNICIFFNETAWQSEAFQKDFYWENYKKCTVQS